MKKIRFERDKVNGMHTEQQQPMGIIRRINWNKNTASMLLDFAERYDRVVLLFESFVFLSQTNFFHASEFQKKINPRRKHVFLFTPVLEFPGLFVPLLIDS